MNNSEVLKGIAPGQVITAEWLNKVMRAVNRNTGAYRQPRTNKTAENALVGAVSSGGLTDLTFTETQRTETTSTITDTNGDTHDVSVIDQVVMSNANGDVLTLNFTNP